MRLRRKRQGKNIPIFYRGVRFPSINALGGHLGLTGNQMKNILTDNYTGELFEKEVASHIEKHFQGRACYIAFGKGFHTFEEMATSLHLPSSVVHGIYYKLKEGQSFEEEVQKRYAQSPIIYEGEEYSSVAEFCRKKYLDYALVMSRLNGGMPFDEAVTKEVRDSKGIAIYFRGSIFPSVRAFFNQYGYARTMEAALQKVAPDLSITESFDLYLKFVERNALPKPDQMLTSIPMVYYNGAYHLQRKRFFAEVGITPRQFGHELHAKENNGRTEEEIVLRMSSRINGHTGEKMFPACTIDPQGTLVFVKNRFIEEIETEKQKKRLG